jgi:hypothetical protein
MSTYRSQCVFDPDFFDGFNAMVYSIAIIETPSRAWTYSPYDLENLIVTSRFGADF